MTWGGALLGVIPSVMLVGPLAVVAALFPGVFARLAVGMKCWRAFLTVASLNSTLALVFYFTQSRLPDSRAFSVPAFTAYLVLVTAAGFLWAGRRYRRMAAADPAVTAAPSRRELTALAALTFALLLLAASARLVGPWGTALEIPMREFTFIAIAMAAATLYAGYRAMTPRVDRLPDSTEPPVRLSLSGESVGLAALFLCGLVTALLTWNETAGGTRTAAVESLVGDAAENVEVPRFTDAKVFELPAAHQVISGILAVGDRLYLGASKPGFTSSSGFVFALDRETGKPVWAFDAGEELKPVFSTPALADGKLYFGEGLHTDSGCKAFCVDAATGQPAWAKPFETSSHTEGTPRVADGRAYFSAGDDGLFCVDARAGTEVWHFPGESQNLHIDTPPTVVGDRLFAGSGYKTYALLGLNAKTGKEVWRTPVPLRSFGAPLALGRRVVYGLGTGNLMSDVEGDEKQPAGRVTCVDAATGKEVWAYDLTRSVHTPLAADAFGVYATSRDGAVHCLDRKTGQLRWRRALGATITAGPVVAGYGLGGAVYAVSTEGRAACLNARTGQVIGARDLAEVTGRQVEVLSTPAVVAGESASGSTRSVYVGVMLTNRNNKAKSAAVVRLDDQVGEE